MSPYQDCLLVAELSVASDCEAERGSAEGALQTLPTCWAFKINDGILLR